jgi:hypothetical protein
MPPVAASAHDEEARKTRPPQCLQHRATVAKRMGVPYQLRDEHDASWRGTSGGISAIAIFYAAAPSCLTSLNKPRLPCSGENMLSGRPNDS